MNNVVTFFKDAWHDVVKRYEKYGRDDSPYWYETDVVAALVCQLQKQISSLQIGLDVRTNVELSKSKWKDFQLLNINSQEKERELLDRLKWCYRERFNKNFRGKPHFDIVVFDLQTVESKPEPLDTVAEIKFSEYVKGKRKGKITAEWPLISYDICRLKSLKKLELCKNAFFCYLDEYHWKKEDNVEKKIKSEIGESRIRYLYSNMRPHFR